MRNRLAVFVALAAAALLVGAACDTSDDEERLAAQQLFRNYLLQEDDSTIADVRIQGLVDELPPDFPVHDDLELLGSAFTDTDETRELIVGWQSRTDANAIFDFYLRELDVEPWSIDNREFGPRVAGVDFIPFHDADSPAFRGELRIAQEGEEAVVVLIARVDLTVENVPAPTGS